MDKKYKFQVNLGGMIELLSDHLYSSPDVYIRELMQNGIDAITDREKYDLGYRNSKEGALMLALNEGESLVFADNGIGLTEEEIHRFLSIIGESSKRDIETGDILNEYIGRFGIGILACFMVSDNITIKTKSAKDEKAHIWVGRPDGTYTIETLTEDIPIGTQVYLNCKKGCGDYFTKNKLKELITYYGLILAYPVFLVCDGKAEQLNSVVLPWDKEHVSSAEVMDFGRELFKTEFLDYTLIKSDEGNISGVAYILPYSVSAATKQKHRLFLKNMLLTETPGELIPDWAVFTKCILNARDLRPTASRENFYEDNKLKTARDNISQCLFKYIRELARNNEQLFAAFMTSHQFAVKSVACENDELYKEFIDYFTFQTTFGEITGREIREAGQALYCSHEKYRQLAQLFTAQHILLVDTSYVFDHTLLQKMSELLDVSILPVIEDEIGNIFSDITDKEQEMSASLIKIARERLAEYGCKVDVKRFKPDTVQCFYTLNEAKEIFDHLTDMRKSEEYSLFDEMFEELSEDFEEEASATLFLNIDNPVIQQLVKLAEKRPSRTVIEKVQRILCVLYVQTLLIGNFPLRNNELALMNDNLIGIIGDTLS